MANKIHTVAKGESLSLIAKKYGTTVSAIQKANATKIKDVNKIQIGWVLTIPVSNGSDSSETIKRQFATALEDVQNLPSVQKLLSLLGY